MGMSQWAAAPDGKYWLDIALDRFDYVLMLDTGLTDNRHWVGCEVEPSIYVKLKSAGCFRP